MNIYIGFDKVKESTFTIFGASTDGEAIRNNFLQFIRILPADDIDIYHVGNISDGSHELTLCESRKVDIEKSYRFPDEVIKNISKSRNEDLKAMADLVQNPDSARDLTDLTK